jgi:quercetin dioxygenase-like cupin family protein
MKTAQLLEGLEFHDKNPYADPLFVDKYGRIIRFTLRPGQEIIAHDAPHSPFYVAVLKGRGVFKGDDGREQSLGPNALAIFDPGEMHTVRALDEELVFIGFLHGTPLKTTDDVGGKISRRAVTTGGKQYE